MSGPSSLPGMNQPVLDVPLPSLSPVKPEHKALILSWMWFSEQATRDTNDPTVLSLLKNSAPQIASELVKLQYQLDVTAEAIQVYYDQVRRNAEEMAGFDWNEVTVGKVVRSQRSEALMYGELKSVLDSYDIKVSLNVGLYLFPAEGIFHVRFGLSLLMVGDRIQILWRWKTFTQ